MKHVVRSSGVKSIIKAVAARAEVSFSSQIPQSNYHTSTASKSIQSKNTPTFSSSSQGFNTFAAVAAPLLALSATAALMSTNDNNKNEEQSFADKLRANKSSVNFDELLTRTEKLPSSSDNTSNNQLQYLDQQRPQGGSEIGHMVAFKGKEDEPIIAKAGVSLTHVGKMVELAFNETQEMKKEDRAISEGGKAARRLGFVVDAYYRNAMPETDKKESTVPEIMKEYLDQKAAKKELIESFNNFLKTDTADKLFDRMSNGENLNIADAVEIQKSLASENERSKEIIGAATYADIVNHVSSQQITNKLQSDRIAKEDVPTAYAFSETEGNRSLAVGSKLIKGAEGLDSFLMQPFLDAANITSKQFKEASELSEDVKKKSKKGEYSPNEKEQKALETLSKLQSDDVLAQGKKDLKAKIEEKGLNGLYESIATRFVFGERTDLGPDNMLYKDGQVINIDVTGFRYTCKDDFTDKKAGGAVSKGWESTFNDTDNLSANLLNKKTFSQRYAGEAKKVAGAINEVLDEAIGGQAKQEVGKVIDFFASQNTKELNGDLEKFMNKLASGLSEDLRPSKEAVDNIAKRNQKYLTDISTYAKHRVQAYAPEEQTLAK